MNNTAEQEKKSAKRKRSEDTAAEGCKSESHDEKTPKGEEGSQEETKEEDELWTEEMHRNFVMAIYDTGVAQSSPSVILENMDQHPAECTAAAASSLTSERVKSHLQKYRKNKDKSKEEFLKEYDSFLRKAVTVGGASGIMPPAAMIEMMGGGKPSGGDIAAFLSYSVMTEGEDSNQNTNGNSTMAGRTGVTPMGGMIQQESQDFLQNFAGTHLPFPQLTEEEKQSPLGVSMVYVMGLFSSLSQHMVNERRNEMNSSQQPPHASSSSMPPPANVNTTSGTAPFATNPNIANQQGPTAN